jgi:hypothetical protein
MRKILLVSIAALTICLSSCGGTPKLVTVNLDVPARPTMQPVNWTHSNNAHCVDDVNAKSLQRNVSRLNAHIEVLEVYIKKGE